MPRKIVHLIVTVLLSTISLFAHAEEKQTFVIGLSSGFHSFDTVDDFRSSNMVIDDFAGSSGIFAEWYIFERLGVGVRTKNIGLTETVTACSLTCSSGSSEIDITNIQVTLNYLPFISDSGYTRIGLNVGAGPSKYRIQSDYTTPSVSDSASGSAISAGIYFDWGGELFGARLAYESFSSNHGSASGYNLDASGTTTSLDLRWAF